MTLVPDTKDWTWVLEKTCPECGFDTRAVTRAAIPGLLRENAAAWGKLLNAQGETACVRPSSERWSTLEYACHVRDVFRKFYQRVQLMVSTEDPVFPNWDQDATAINDRYNEQSPAEVSDQLTMAAKQLAERFSQLAATEWGRPGTRSDGAGFTVETLGRYLMHDPVHHLYDVGVAGDVGGRPPRTSATMGSAAAAWSKRYSSASTIRVTTLTDRSMAVKCSARLTDGRGRQITASPPFSLTRLMAPISAPRPAESTKGTSRISRTTFLPGGKPATEHKTWHTFRFEAAFEVKNDGRSGWRNHLLHYNSF